MVIKNAVARKLRKEEVKSVDMYHYFVRLVIQIQTNCHYPVTLSRFELLFYLIFVYCMFFTENLTFILYLNMF